jgi:hypothetical protein
MTVPVRKSPQAQSSPLLNQGLSDPQKTIENGESGANERQPWRQLLRMMVGSWISRAIYVAAKLRVADHLTDGPASAEELAAAASVAPGPQYRILRALAGVGVFARQADGRFCLNPLAEPLRAGVPGSLRAFAVTVGEETDRSWCDVLETVRTGEPAFDPLPVPFAGMHRSPNV